MSKNYKLLNTSLGSDWDIFNLKSKDSSVFANTDYLKSTNAKLGLYKILNSDEIRAQIFLVENDCGDEVIEDDLVIYSGIIFGNSTNNQNKAQVLSERFDILSFFIKEITKKYKKINLSLNPSIKDIRPFQWHNYKKKEYIFTTNIKYTSYIDIKDFKRDRDLLNIECFRNASSSRRQEIRYSKKNKLKFSKSSNIEIFLRFYKDSLTKQSIFIPEKEINRIRNLLNDLIALGIAHIFCSHNIEGEIASIAIFIVEEFKAYYMFGASNHEERNSFSGTHVLWESFFELAEMGIQLVDLEGVNSPKRGWFKLSFGGELIPYYKVSYQ